MNLGSIHISILDRAHELAFMPCLNDAAFENTGQHSITMMTMSINNGVRAAIYLHLNRISNAEFE